MYVYIMKIFSSAEIKFIDLAKNALSGGTLTFSQKAEIGKLIENYYGALDNLSVEEFKNFVLGQVLYTSSGEDTLQQMDSSEKEERAVAYLNHRGGARFVWIYEAKNRTQFLSQIAAVFGEDIAPEDWTIVDEYNMIAVAGECEIDLGKRQFFCKDKNFIRQSIQNKLPGKISPTQMRYLGDKNFAVLDEEGLSYQVHLDSEVKVTLELRKYGNLEYVASSQLLEDCSCLEKRFPSIFLTKEIVVYKKPGLILIQNPNSREFEFLVEADLSDASKVRAFRLDPLSLEKSHEVLEMLPPDWFLPRFIQPFVEKNLVTGEYEQVTAMLKVGNYQTGSKIVFEMTKAHGRQQYSLMQEDNSYVYVPDIGIKQSLNAPFWGFFRKGSDDSLYGFFWSEALEEWMLIPYNQEKEEFLTENLEQAAFLAGEYHDDEKFPKRAYWEQIADRLPWEMNEEDGYAGLFSLEIRLMNHLKKQIEAMPFCSTLECQQAFLKLKLKMDIFWKFDVNKISFKDLPKLGLSKKEAKQFLAVTLPAVLGLGVVAVGDDPDYGQTLIKQMVSFAKSRHDSDLMDICEMYGVADLEDDLGFAYDNSLDEERFTMQETVEVPLTVEIEDYFHVEDVRQGLSAGDLATRLKDEEKEIEDHLTLSIMRDLQKDLKFSSMVSKKRYAFKEEPELALNKIQIEYRDIAKREGNLQEELKYLLFKHLNVGQNDSFISVDELVIAYGGKKIDQLLERNPRIDLESIQALLPRYLRASRSYNRTQYVLALTKTLQRKLKKGLSDEQAQVLVQKIALAMEAEPEFDLAENPEYAVLEYFEKINLYGRQVKALNELLAGSANQDSLIKEILMGEGKSKVLAPLYALMMADGEQLACVVAPDALLKDMENSLSSSLENMDRLVELVDITRQTSVEQADLERLLLRLQRAQKEGRVLLMSTLSYRALYLKFLEMLLGTESTEDEVAVMRAIWRLLLSSRQTLIDEADMVQDINQELNFSFGAKRTLTHRERDIGWDLVQILSGDERITSRLKSDVTGPEGTLFRNDFYRFDIKGILAEEILPSLGFVKDSNRNLILSYVLDEKDVSASIEKSFNSEEQEDLAFVKGMLNVVLPLALAKHLDEDYGIGFKPLSLAEKDLLLANILNESHQEEVKSILNSVSPDLKRRFVALKIKASNMEEQDVRKRLNKVIEENAEPYAIPAKGVGELLYGSQFASHYLTYMLTLFAYQVRGMPAEYFEQRLEKIRAKKVREDKAFVPPEECRAMREYQVLCGEDSPRVGLFEDSAVAYVQEKVNGNQELLRRELNAYAISKVGSYPEELSADGMVFAYLAKQTTGFTGTVANTNKFHHDFTVRKAKGVAGKVAGLIWEKCRDGFLSLDLPVGSVEGLVAEFLKHSQDQVKALADPGAYFRGISNESVAKELLKQDVDGRFSGVVFYNEDQEQVIWEKGALKAIPLKDSKLSADQRLTYYDQLHCTGSDIKQADDAVIFIAVGEDNSIRDLSQTLYRMRGIESGQGAMIAISKDLESLIRKEQSLGDESLNLFHLIMYMLSEEARSQGKENIQAQLMGMKAAFLEEVLAVLVDEEVSVAEAQQVVRSIKSFYVTEASTSALDLFSGHRSQVSALTFIEQEKKTFKENVESSLAASRVLRTRIDRKDLEEKVDAIVDYEALPEFTETQLGEGAVTDAITVQQVTTEQEAEEELEVSVENAGSNVLHTSTMTDSSSFKRGWGGQQLSWKYSNCDSGNYDSSNEFRYFSLKEIMQRQSPISAYARLFDRGIYLTENFYSVYGHSNPARIIARNLLFDPRRNLSQWVLISRTEDTYDLTALDAVDVMQWQELLFEVQKSKNSFNSWFKGKTYEEKMTDSSMLYSLGSSVPVLVGEELNAEKVLADPKLQRLLIQYKFFQGTLNYSYEEFGLLAAWVKEKSVGLEAVRGLFEEWILPTRPDLQEKYQDSSLYLFLHGIEDFSGKSGDDESVA